MGYTSDGASVMQSDKQGVLGKLRRTINSFNSLSSTSACTNF